MPAIIQAVQSVDKTGAIIGDIITYRIGIKNVGDTSANSVIFSDEIPVGMSFIADSFIMDNVNYSGVNPQAQRGIAIGNINPGLEFERKISFKVRIDTMPDPNIFRNSASIKYKYTENPQVPNGVTDITDSNVVTTTVSRVGVDINHKVDLTGITIGDTLTYTTELTNTGNISLNNVVLVNTIPSETDFVDNSVYINSNNILGATPLGITLGTIQQGALVTVTYKVIAKRLPPKIQISNKVYVNYNYTLDPQNPSAISAGIISNSVNTSIGKAILEANNYVNTRGATLGDNLDYTIAVRNIGNIVAENVILIDTIPQAVAFIVDTLSLNGMIQVGETTDPPGFEIGSILPGESLTISFKVMVNTIANPNTIINNASISYNYTSNTNYPGADNGGVNTNEVITEVNKAIIDVRKAVDRIIVAPGEKVHYTLELHNTGNAVANNVVIVDTIPNYLKFVENSLAINDITQLGVNPQSNNRILLDDIWGNEIIGVSFDVIVVTMPSGGIIKNSATVTYSYIVNHENLSAIKDGSISNEVNTSVVQAVLSLRGTKNRLAVDVGGYIKYGVEIKNDGNIKASNIKLTNTIPYGSLFYPESVSIDNVNDINQDPTPPIGIMLNDLQPGDIRLVTFDVVVTTLPNPNVISNSATVTYNYSSDSLRPNQFSGASNTSGNNVTVNKAIISIRKSVNNNEVRTDEEVNIGIVLTNVGNVDATNIILIDTIPDGMLFVTDSVNIGTVNQLGETPQPPSGVLIPRLVAGNTLTLTYKIKAIELVEANLQMSNASENMAFTYFDYVADPSLPNPSKGTASSNSVIINIKEANLVANNSVSKTNAAKGDILEYRILISNQGNIRADNVIFNETLPARLELVKNSVAINGNIQNGVIISKTSGVVLGTIEAMESKEITFKAVIKETPAQDTLAFLGTIRYEYTIGLGKTIKYMETTTPNQIVTTVKGATIDYTNGGGLRKYTDKPFATIGETITYNIELENTGNTSAINVVLIDTIPNSFTFIEDSVVMDGNIQYGDTPQYPSGISLGEIGPREMARLSYKVRVNTIPNPNIISTSSTIRYNYVVEGVYIKTAAGNSNVVKNTINNAFISNEDGGLIQSVDKSIVGIGGILTYVIELKNTGNIVANNVIYRDVIPTETTFVQNSVVLDKIARLTMDPYQGISVDKIKPGETHTVSFKVKVNNLGTLKPIVNTGRVDYDYVLDPSLPKINNCFSLTNTITTPVGVVKMSRDNGGYKKTVDKVRVDVGDIVTYTVVLTNTGNIAAKKTILYDTVPRNMEFIANSTAINGVVVGGQSPNTGLNIGDVLPQVSVTITYKAVIKSLINNQFNKIPNNSEIYYQTDI